MPQIFGKDTLLAMGGESAESRQQWAEDMDLDVRPSATPQAGSSYSLLLQTPFNSPELDAGAADSVCKA